MGGSSRRSAELASRRNATQSPLACACGACQKTVIESRGNSSEGRFKCGRAGRLASRGSAARRELGDRGIAMDAIRGTGVAADRCRPAWRRSGGPEAGCGGRAIGRGSAGSWRVFTWVRPRSGAMADGTYTSGARRAGVGTASEILGRPGVARGTRRGVGNAPGGTGRDCGLGVGRPRGG